MFCLTAAMFMVNKVLCYNLVLTRCLYQRSCRAVFSSRVGFILHDMANLTHEEQKTVGWIQ